MISPQHFLAPLTEKRNLILIFLIALFFSIFRLSGGGVTTAPRNVLERGTDASAAPEVDLSSGISDDFSDLNGITPKADIKRAERQRTSDDRVVEQTARRSAPSAAQEDLLGSMRRAGTESRPSAKEGTPNNKSKLAEIERSLGLR